MPNLSPFTGIPQNVTHIATSVFFGTQVDYANLFFARSADEATITSANFNLIGAVTIPQQIRGTSITAIAPNALAGQTQITSLTIPNTVRTIGTNALIGMTNLQTVALPWSSNKGHFGRLFGSHTPQNQNNFVPASLSGIIITHGSSIGNSAF